MTSSEIKKEARDNLAGKWGKGVLITLVYAIIEALLSFISKKAGNGTALSSIINIITFIISAPLSLGLVFSFMKLKRNEEVGTFDFLTLGFSNFGKSWRLYGCMFLKLIVPILLGFVSAVMISVGLVAQIFNTNLSEFSATSSGSPVILVLGTIILVAASIFSYIISLSLSLVYNIAYDEPELTGKETVKKSQELMDGNKSRLFVLTLSFIGWTILSVFTFGIGFLWLIPYIQVSTICFYDEIVKKN